jgi:hypothetical protein
MVNFEQTRMGGSIIQQAMQSPSTSVASTAVVPSNPPAQRARRKIWPAAEITFGLVLTVAWVCLLGYGLIELVRLAIQEA